MMISEDEDESLAQFLKTEVLFEVSNQRDEKDMVDLGRICPVEFKEYYVQMQAAKRSQAPLSSQDKEENWSIAIRKVAEIKRTAKIGNEAATKILAKQLIRLRQHISNFQGNRTQMRVIATHTQAMHTQSSVAAGMKGASKVMAAMNKVNDDVLAVDNTLFLFFRYHPPDDYMCTRDDPLFSFSVSPEYVTHLSYINILTVNCCI